MTDESEWGDLILWHGGECPVPQDTEVQVLSRYFFSGIKTAKMFDWGRNPNIWRDFDIIAYRVRKKPVEPVPVKVRLGVCDGVIYSTTIVSLPTNSYTHRIRKIGDEFVLEKL